MSLTIYFIILGHTITKAQYHDRIYELDININIQPKKDILLTNIKSSILHSIYGIKLIVACIVDMIVLQMRSATVKDYITLD